MGQSVCCNGACVQTSYALDGDNDCGDMSDENLICGFWNYTGKDTSSDGYGTLTWTGQSTPISVMSTTSSSGWNNGWDSIEWLDLRDVTPIAEPFDANVEILANANIINGGVVLIERGTIE